MNLVVVFFICTGNVDFENGKNPTNNEKTLVRSEG